MSNDTFAKVQESVANPDLSINTKSAENVEQPASPQWVMCPSSPEGCPIRPEDGRISLEACPTLIMPYLSIDIETTGLEDEWCQILEFGCVFDDGISPVEELPTFHRYLVHERIVGQPFALQMNAAILKAIATRAAPRDRSFIYPGQLAGDFANWLFSTVPADVKSPYTPAGKNFGSFDRQFLKRLPDFTRRVRLHHRAIDPALYYWRPYEDSKLPDMKVCLERAGLAGEVPHTAVEDARLVVKLIREGIRRTNTYSGLPPWFFGNVPNVLSHSEPKPN